jgi:hypothetical protein
METLSRTVQEQNTQPEILNQWNVKTITNQFLGDKKGTCCLCGQETNYGYKKKFGGNFTAGPEVSQGDVVCEFCKPLISRSNELRRSMWIITNDEFKKFKKQEAKDIILNLPDEPFILYLTNTWQKVGWIKMLNKVNPDNKGLICCCVDYDTYFVEVEAIQELFKTIEELRELKIPKAELETGELSMHHYRKLDNPRNTAKKIKKYAHSPIWRLCVYLNE